MKKIQLFYPLLVAAVGLCAQDAFAQVTLSDGTFNDGDWSLAVAFNSCAPGESADSAAQTSNGGNPGSFRSTSLTFGHGEIVVSELNSGANYDPGTQGSVSTINYSYDFLKQFPIGFGAIRYALAIEQNGTLFVDAGEAPTDESWTAHSHLNLSASDFYDLTPSHLQGSNHPDFSASGAAMQFGFIVANDNPAGPSSSQSGIDNWSVTISAVPEPAQVSVVVGVGLLGVALLRRKRAIRSIFHSTT